MKEIKAYAYRESADSFLPRDVLDALGEPGHVQQGSLVVFAPSAAAAWRRLCSLCMDLGRASAGRLLAPATANAAQALQDARKWNEGQVLAWPKSGGFHCPVVEVTRWDDGVRTIIQAGRFVNGTYQAIEDGATR